MHLFFSPHFDDAALSCGGQISHLVRRGEAVTIFTLMAGGPPAEFKLSEITEHLHERWNLGPNPVDGRRKEDEAAAKALGATLKFGPYADAIYRVDPNTAQPLYAERDALFAKVHPNDPVLQTKRAAVIQAIIAVFNLQEIDVIHFPLAVGQHVDHQLVRDMGKALMRWRPNNPIYFYEDYPYMREGEPAIQAAVTALDVPVTRVTHELAPTDIDARISAIRCYKSQLQELKWFTPEAMSSEVRSTIARIGGEREWRMLYAADSPLT